MEYYDIYLDTVISAADFSAKKFFDELKAAGSLPIRLFINSEGGSVFEAFASLDLSKVKGRLIDEVYVTGLAASAATVFTSMGKKTYVGSSSFLMIHNPYGGPDTEENLNTLAKIKETLLDIYESKIARSNPTKKLSRQELSEMMDKETFLTAQEAIDYGFADAITTEYAIAARFNNETYTDYPQAASDNAKKVLDWIDEYGRDEVSGMTQVGLARANQLANRSPLSEDTVKRMAQFNRHRNNAEIADEYKGTPWKDKGYVAWLGWGGTEGIDWAIRKTEQIENKMKQNEETQNILNKIAQGFNRIIKNTFKNAMRVTLEDGTELYVYSDDGELEGKEVVLIKDGEITEEKAPNGTHDLRGGRKITVNDGIITSVTEDEDMENKFNQEELVAAISGQLKNSLDEVKNEFKENFDGFKADFEGFKNDSNARLDALEAKVSGETQEAKANAEAAKAEAEKAEAEKVDVEAQLRAAEDLVAKLKSQKTSLDKEDNGPEEKAATSKRMIPGADHYHAKYVAMKAKQGIN